jgi:hypothetical protein
MYHRVNGEKRSARRRPAGRSVEMVVAESPIAPLLLRSREVE